MHAPIAPRRSVRDARSVLPPALQDFPALGLLLRGTGAPFDALPGAAREALLEQAVRHGLLAAVAGTLPADAPQLRARFDRMATGMRLRDARARAVLAEVLGLLAGAGLVPVALKGPLLADRLYRTPGLRASDDLDLLVSPDQLRLAAEALRPAGFTGSDPIQEAYALRRHHHLQLHRAPGPSVELHFRASSACGADLPTAELLARSGAHPAAPGLVARLLAPEDELLTLAVHAAGHAFARLGWLLDLALFVRHHPGLDWDEVARRAQAYRCRRALACALSALRAVEVPVPAVPSLALEPARERLAAALARDAAVRTDRRGAVLWMAYQQLLRDRARELPGFVLTEAAWVVRRRVLRLRRRLRPRGAALPPPRPAPEATAPGGAPEQRVLPEPFWQPVHGRSMAPTLRDGDEVLLEAATAVGLGDVVVLRNPAGPGTLLHRVVALEGAHLVTRGDNRRTADPPARRAHVLFRAVARRRRGRVSSVPPAPAGFWRRLIAPGRG